MSPALNTISLPVFDFSTRSSEMVRRLLRTIRILNCACMDPLDQINEKKVQLAHEILQYLVDNPNAGDTFDGIVEWWLMVRSIKHQSALVKEALAMLVADGLVIAHEGSGPPTYYKLNLMEREKIISLLQKRS